MIRRPCVFLRAALVMLAIAPLDAAAASIDQYQSESYGSGRQIYPGSMFAQIIHAGRNGTLTAVGFGFECSSRDDVGFEVQIRAVGQDGTPSDEILGLGRGVSHQDCTLGIPEYEHVTLSEPAIVHAGTAYALVLLPDNYVNVRQGPAAEYGHVFSFWGSPHWSAEYNHFVFATYVEDAVCGDVVVHPMFDEECDNGTANTPNGDCTDMCKLAVCGDGLVSPGEVCDDGDGDDDNACNNDCSTYCAQDEQCSQGQICSAGSCTTTCNPLQYECGDRYACVLDPDGQEQFVCEVDASVAAGSVFDGCGADDECRAGLACADVSAAYECDPQHPGCCLPYCDVGGFDECFGVGQFCGSVYEAGYTPPGLESVGVCRLF